jgi:hypothetical protein
MAVLFSDDFNRANSGTVDATNWTENAGSDWEIATNALACVAQSFAPVSCLTTASAHAANTDVKVTITQVSTASDGGAVARWSGNGATSTGYVADCYNGRCELYRHNNSSSGTLIGSGVNVTLAANGVIALETSGTGATVTVKSYYQGTLRETVGDTNASRITTAGRTGVYSWTIHSWDNFQVEDLTAGGTTISPGAGLVALTGVVPLLAFQYGLGVGALAMSGFAPGVSVGAAQLPNDAKIVIRGAA